MTEEQYRAIEKSLLNRVKAVGAEIERLTTLRGRMIIDLDKLYQRKPVLGVVADGLQRAIEAEEVANGTRYAICPECCSLVASIHANRLCDKCGTFVKTTRSMGSVSAELLGHLRRLKAMMPLFCEVRDALCAISTAQMKLHNISPSLADRMDDIGVPGRWKAIDKIVIEETEEVETDGT